MFTDLILWRKSDIDSLWYSSPSLSLSDSLLIRKLVPEIIVLAMRILQAILHFLHMLASITSHTIDNQGNDTSLPNSIATAFPPHGASQSSLLDVVYFCC